MEKRRKVGIMGGTFDPIHLGHLILGEKAYEQLGLETVLFMPSGNPPHKRHREGRASDEDRSEMVGLAIADNPHFALSLMEMHEEGYTYTFHTLETLCHEHPDTDYYFIIGADSLYSFDTWREPQRICDACTLVVAARNHVPDDELDAAIRKTAAFYHADIIRLDTMNIDISSHIIRKWTSDSKSLKYYVTDPVMDYISKHGLYQKPEIGDEDICQSTT